MHSKYFFFPALGISAILSVVLAPTPSKGDVATEEAAVAALLAEVTAQQTVIGDNQAKIDAKLATITENVRVARIFVSRGGGKAR